LDKEDGYRAALPQLRYSRHYLVDSDWIIDALHGQMKTGRTGPVGLNVPVV